VFDATGKRNLGDCASAILRGSLDQSGAAMFKKYLTFFGTNAGSIAPLETCPSEIWSAPQALAAYARISATSSAQPSHVELPDRTPTAESVAADLAQAKLHARVIALENLMIALLSTATEQQLDCACDRAVNISPRNGSTQHSLTKKAAAEMLSIVARAIQYRDMPK
jgi:hypothetical protein